MVQDTRFGIVNGLRNFCVLCFVFCTLSLGCGYTTSSTLPSNLKTIHVELFKNNISFSREGSRNLYLPLLEVKVRNAVINRFLFDGNLRIADLDQADLVLKGELKSYDRTILRYTDNDDAEEYRIHITVAMELWNAQKGELAWTESSFVGEATYFVTGALAKSEEAAVDSAIEDLARRIVERTIEDW